MITNIVTILASGFGVWAIFKYVVLIEMRIDANTFKTLFDLCKDDRKIILNEEFISEARYPVIYSAICFFNNAPWFYLHHSERLMQAGWHGKDHVTIVSCFRWKYKTMKQYFQKKLKEMQLHTLGVPVQVMLPDYTDKIGSLKEIFPEPIADESLWKDFELEVAEVADGVRAKTSALLYGSPGNGKTSLVKYLATKYRLPIMVFTLNPDWNNHDLLLLFAQIPKRCIVLFEDFDNYFDGRKCIIGGGDINKVKFTFDIILNGLDGIYTTYENVVFIMTVNDINKVDYALKNRPSRFKFTRNFCNPSFKIRSKLISHEWAELSEGFNLDQIFRLKEYYEKGISFMCAIKMLEKEISFEETQKKAFERFQQRQRKNIEGNEIEDWNYALNSPD